MYKYLPYPWAKTDRLFKLLHLFGTKQEFSVTMLHTPILFVVFNRPHTTARVFEAIRQAKPRQLFIASDGPRAGHPTDASNCEKVRQIVAAVDWDCEVKTLYQPRNLGCRQAVSTGITWFFEQVEEGIILEDDTLPSHSFFSFCQELLERYRSNEQIMMISGDNFQWGKWRGEGSYYFSGYTHIWGWASWRRAWKYYDVAMKDFTLPEAKTLLRQRLKSPLERTYWLRQFQKAYLGEVDTWDYQWTYAVWKQNGLAVMPNINLVSNIGFGAGATNTAAQNNKLSEIPAGEINSIIHPKVIERNEAADHHGFMHILDKKMLLKVLLNYCTGFFK